MLGRARVELGGAAEGIELMRKGISGLVEVGFGLGIGMHTASLGRRALAQRHYRRCSWAEND